MTKNYYYDGSRLIAEKWSTGAYLLYHYDENSSIYAVTYSSTGSGFYKYYLLKNLQGDVVQILNASNDVVANYSYDAWGNLLEVTDANEKVITSANNFALINPIRYRGYYYDSETGFYYLKSRYYDPENCRFISADSQIDLNSGTTNLNLFAYCGNDPVNRVDPDGHFWLIVAAVVAVAVCVTSCSKSPEVYPELPPTKKEPTFSSIKDAAIHAANEFYSFTKYSGKEYGAAIYKNSDEDCYRLTSISRGTDRDVFINTSDVKDGKIVGYVHSHAYDTISKFTKGDFSFDPEKRLEYYVVEPIRGGNYGKLYKFNSATPGEPDVIVEIGGRELTYDEKNLYRP